MLVFFCTSLIQNDVTVSRWVEEAVVSPVSYTYIAILNQQDEYVLHTKHAYHGYYGTFETSENLERENYPNS